MECYLYFLEIFLNDSFGKIGMLKYDKKLFKQKIINKDAGTENYKIFQFNFSNNLT